MQHRLVSWLQSIPFRGISCVLPRIHRSLSANCCCGAAHCSRPLAGLFQLQERTRVSVSIENLHRRDNVIVFTIARTDDALMRKRIGPEIFPDRRILGLDLCAETIRVKGLGKFFRAVERYASGLRDRRRSVPSVDSAPDRRPASQSTNVRSSHVESVFCCVWCCSRQQPRMNGSGVIRASRTRQN